MLLNNKDKVKVVFGKREQIRMYLNEIILEVKVKIRNMFKVCNV